MSLFFGLANEKDFEAKGDIDMGGHSIDNLKATPVSDHSAVTKKWVDNHSSSGLIDAGFTMKGDINMDGYSVTGLRQFYAKDSDAVSKKYVATNYVNKCGDSISGTIHMNNNEILTLTQTPATDGSAVCKKWVEDYTAANNER